MRILSWLADSSSWLKSLVLYRKREGRGRVFGGISPSAATGAAAGMPSDTHLEGTCLTWLLSQPGDTQAALPSTDGQETRLSSFFIKAESESGRLVL